MVRSMERPTIKPGIISMTNSRKRSMNESTMEPVSESSNVESTPTRVATVVSIVIVLVESSGDQNEIIYWVLIVIVYLY